MVLSAGTITTGVVLSGGSTSTSSPTPVDVTTPFAVPYSPANPTPSLETVGSSSSPGGVLGTSSASPSAASPSAPANTFAPASTGGYSTLNSATPSATNLPSSLADFLQNPLYMGIAGVLLLFYIRK